MTTAKRGPVVVGCVVSVTVSDVDVARVTVPTAPLLRATAFADGVAASNPVPQMTTIGELRMLFAELGVTEGDARAVATTTAGPLDSPNEVTAADSCFVRREVLRVVKQSKATRALLFF